MLPETVARGDLTQATRRTLNPIIVPDANGRLSSP